MDRLHVVKSFDWKAVLVFVYFGVVTWAKEDSVMITISLLVREETLSSRRALALPYNMCLFARSKR